ncbi:MAG: peptidoglycan/LPS O-acetylase OafA/YrhL [Parvicella sp.]
MAGHKNPFKNTKCGIPTRKRLSMKKLSQLYNSLARNPQSVRFMPFIDGLRFLAIIPVIFQHANERLLKYNSNINDLSGWEAQLSFLISRGTIGVFIFFAVSGFVLTLPFAKGQLKFSYKTYISRRLNRIEPPFIFWISCFALIFIIQGNMGIGNVLNHYLATITYSHNIIYGEYSIINPVAWSLEVEIQYYLIAPFIALLYFGQSNLGTRRSLLIAFLFILITYQNVFGLNLYPFKATLLGQIQYFLIGMLMADLYANDSEIKYLKTWVWDGLAPILLLVMAYTWTDEFYKTIIFNLSLGLVFIAGFKGNIFPKLLSVKWITIIGGMCYTIYLTHLPLLELFYSVIGKFGYSSAYWVQLSISLIIAIPIVLLSSVIFFKAIEKPFMKSDGFRQMLKNIKQLFIRQGIQIEKQKS